MPQIVSSDSHCTVVLSFWEKVWSLHGNFTIHKSDIVSATRGKPETTWKELRVPGTFLPGVIKAGTYLTSRGKEFWYVSRTCKFPLTIEITNSSYKRIIIGFQTESKQHSALALIQQ